MPHGRIGHRVADLVRENVVAIDDERDGISTVLADEFSVAVERQADVTVAVRVLQILPAEVLESAARLETAGEEIEDRRLVARLVGAGDESVVNGHALLLRSGSHARPSTGRHGASP